jgi:hypothetical protein
VIQFIVIPAIDQSQDETVVTMRVMDLEVCDVSPSGETIALLQLTIPRDVVCICHLFSLRGRFTDL